MSNSHPGREKAKSAGAKPQKVFRRPGLKSAAVKPEQDRLRELQVKLKATREELEATIAQLRQANDRLQASNEESTLVYKGRPPGSAGEAAAV